MLFCLGAVADGTSTNSITLRPVGDGIRWQTCLGPAGNGTVTWRWDDGADSASLTVTCHVERTVIGPVGIARAAGEKYGSYEFGSSWKGARRIRLYDFALVMSGDGNVLASQSARVALHPDSIDVRKPSPSRDWRVVDRSAVYAVPYDRSWSGATSAAGAVSLGTVTAEGTGVSAELDGVSGFAPLDVSPLMSGSVRNAEAGLEFDGVTAWEASMTARCASIFVVR